MDLESLNHQQIANLNQRGGRTLTMVDLILAGTITVPMAAEAMRAMHHGASLLTGARPGGAGKTTLMAALLHLLPPGVPIITVDRPDLLEKAAQRSADEPACYLAHELGSGNWYGYIWGRQVGQFLSLIQGQRRIASCLHADTLSELTSILTSPPLHVSRKLVGRIGLLMFMFAGPIAGRFRHRVTTFHEADGRGGHRLLFQWDQKSDSHVPVAPPEEPERLEPYEQFIRRLVDEGQADALAVRGKVVDFYRRMSHSQ